LVALSRRTVAAFAVVLLVHAAAPAIAAAADRFVATTGTDTDNDCLVEADPCQHIQHAVDESEAGDIVNLAAGTYSESVVVSKTIGIFGPFACSCSEPFDPSGEDPDDPSRGGAAEARIVGVGGAPAVAVAAPEVAVAGVTVGPATGPATGSGVLFQSGADDGAIGFSIFEHLERGVDIEGAAGTQIVLNLFRDNDAVGGQAIRGADDDATSIFQNVFRRNTSALDLDGSTNGFAAANVSRGDATFVRSRATDTMDYYINEVRDLTDAGFTLAGDSNVTIEANNIAGTGDGLRVAPDGAGPLTGVGDILGNNFHDLGGNAIHAADGALTDPLTARGNRFFATTGTAVVAEGDSVIDAADNWWGCNEGPGQPGCTGTGGSGQVISGPWTVLTLTADPTSIATGGATSAITASFLLDSDDQAIDPQGIPDDLEVAFSTSLGTIDPDADCTCAGESLTDLTSGDTPGTATVSATLDNATVTTDVEFTGPQARIAPAGGFDFGPVDLGSFSPLQKFTVKNVGTEDLVISSVVTDGDGFVLETSTDTCTGATIVPGAFCSVKARFRPTGSRGARSGALVVDSNAPGSPDRVALCGVALASGVLTPAPSPFSYGTVPVGTSSGLQKFAFKNTGVVDVAVGSVFLSGPNPAQFAVGEDTCTGQTVSPGAFCYVRARFPPTARGAKSAVVRITSPGLAAPANAAISGTASIAAALTIDPAAFAFADVVVGQQSPTQKFTVKNTGGSTVHVTSVDLTGTDAAQFQQTTTTCTGVDLAPGEFCFVKVRFRPTGTPGPREAQLAVTSGAPVSPSATLTGSAIMEV
jgi:hypothetical protein